MLEQILERIQHQGWNMYEIEVVEKATDKTVERGPAPSLHPGKLYVLFPKVADPTSLQQIREALRRLEAPHPYPWIQYKGRCLPIPYLSLKEKQLLVTGQVTLRVPYADFYASLDSLSPAPGPN